MLGPRLDVTNHSRIRLVAFIVAAGKGRRGNALTVGSWGHQMRASRRLQSRNSCPYSLRVALPVSSAIQLFSDGSYAIADWLITMKAPVNAVDRFGFTPLESAVRGKHQELIKLIKSHGGKVMHVRAGPRGHSAVPHPASRAGTSSPLEHSPYRKPRPADSSPAKFLARALQAGDLVEFENSPLAGTVAVPETPEGEIDWEARSSPLPVPASPRSAAASSLRPRRGAGGSGKPSSQSSVGSHSIPPPARRRLSATR